MRSELFSNRKVIPLWWPSPAINLPEKFRETNIRVGDIGAFNDEGGFEVLFNIFLSAIDNIANGFSVPDNFEPYPAGVSKVSSEVELSKKDCQYCCGGFFEVELGSNLTLTPGRFVSLPSSVACVNDFLCREYIAEYSFRSGKENPALGAILELPDGAYKDKISNRQLDLMGQYFDCHAESWYGHYSKLHGYSIANGSLMIVNCTYKTKTWALAICPGKSSRGSIFARVYRKRENTDWYEWEAHKDVKGRRGPELEKLGKERTDLSNQCVAVEVSSIVLATSSFRKSVSVLTKVMSKISVVH
jgi:hypothetical protein